MSDDIDIVLQYATESGDITDAEASRVRDYTLKKGGDLRMVYGILRAHHGLTDDRHAALEDARAQHFRMQQTIEEPEAAYSLPGELADTAQGSREPAAFEMSLPGEVADEAPSLPGELGSRTPSLPGDLADSSAATLPQPPPADAHPAASAGAATMPMDIGFRSQADEEPTPPAPEPLRRSERPTMRQEPPRSGRPTQRHAPPPTPTAAQVDAPPPVSKIGGCSLRKLLGRGAMGAVYLGFHEGFDQDMAVKLLPSERTRQRHFVEMFLKEARALVRVNHENVVRVYNVGEENNQYFIAMELVEGQDLGDLIKAKGTVDPRQAARLFRSAAMGLGAAHKEGLVHRDVKPDNLMITHSGVVKVADFGLAIEAEPTGQGGFSKRKPVGTPYYMPPEQADGEPSDPRSDVYSLGCTLFHALTGQVPFRGKTLMDILVKHVSELPPDPCELNPQVPRALGDICLRMMNKEPEARFASMAEVVAVLQAFDSTGAAPSLGDAGARERPKGLDELPSPPLPTPPPVKGFAMSSGVLIAGVVGALLAFNISTVQALTTDIPPVRSSAEQALAELEQTLTSAAQSPERVERAMSAFGVAWPSLRARARELRQRVLKSGLVSDAELERWKAAEAAARAALKSKEPLKALAILNGLTALRDRIPELDELCSEVQLAVLEGDELAYVPASEDGAAFLIERAEVSNLAYARFLAANPEVEPPAGWESREVSEERAELPVVGVTHADAERYARWAGRRLPSSEEWTRAARGGDDRPFPWGAALNSRLLNARESRKGALVPVGAHAEEGSSGAAPCGALNLSGNAAEWVASEGETAPARGGSYLCPLQACRATSAVELPKETTRPDLGFRCALDLPATSGS